MKHAMLISLVLLVAISMVAAACGQTLEAPIPTTPPLTPSARTTDQKVLLMITRENSSNMELMLTQEVGVMVRVLKAAGYQVVVASASGQPLAGKTTTLTPDMKVADVHGEDYAGIILPCLAAGNTPVPPEAIALVKQAVVAGKPVAAQQSAVSILGQAGVIDGKHYAAQSTVPGGIKDGTGVVQDGNIITSGTCPYLASAGQPDGTTELTQKFITLLASSH